MRIERTKNAARNIVFGSILKIYQIAIPFLMRTALIYFLGVEYLGLSSLFTSVLQVLNLAELGVGSAMVYSMYRPIVEDDTEQICALMRLYRRYYRLIGGIILVLGLILLPFIPKLIKSDVPNDMNIYILYLLNLGATVLSYWLFAYKNSLFSAHQRVDVTSKVTLLTNTIQYGLQLLVLCITKNYYIYLLIAMITQVLTNIGTAYMAHRMYPNYKPIGDLSKEKTAEINQRIRDLFTSKIGAVIVNSADTIVISAFLGLRILAIYQNYFYILTSIVGLVAIIFSACTAGIGNSVIVESKAKNYSDLKNFTFIIFWISGFCCCCLLCLYQPFMRLWVGDDLMLDLSIVVCLCVYYFIYEINQLLNTYKDAAGIWHEDRFRPLVTAGANLMMNLIMVQAWGLYGIILSTVLSMLFVGMPWLLHNLFTVLFEKSEMVSYLKALVTYSCATAAVCMVTFLICNLFELSGWPVLIIRGGISLIVPNVIFWILFHQKDEFAQSLLLLEKIVKGRIHFSKMCG